MPSINILSREISELIAAGEVIERPSSVIKELVENSIDACSKSITVEIKRGGSTFIRITDDGCGISFEDVPKAFLRHATSKVCSRDDLNKILTLGFRGEALASVCAVAKVELMTKQHSDDLGTHYMIEGSDEIMHEQTGCPEGTTIIIRDLFYNVPARQKFMKKDTVEGNMVCAIVNKVALSHPEIAFKMIRDNKIEFSTAGDGNLYSSIFAVYGKSFANDMVQLDYEQDGIHVYGYCIKPLYSKANRSFQNFFVNNRYIKSQICTVAVEEAYKGSIMTGKFPACVIKIDIAPDTVDVNVHPAKVEIRFSDEKPIYSCLYFAVKSALMKSGLIYDFQLKPPVSEKPSEVKYEQPELTNEYAASDLQIEPAENKVHEKPVNPVFKPEYNQNTVALTQKTSNINEDHHISINENADELQTKHDNTRTYPEKSTVMLTSSAGTAAAVSYKVPHTQCHEPDYAAPEEKKVPEKFNYINKDSFIKREENSPAQQSVTAPGKLSVRYIGEAFKGYVIVEIDEKIVIIDKHAAHERIIFERLRSENKQAASQFVMYPDGILLTLDEAQVLSDNVQVLENMGFSLDMSKSPYVYVKAVPTIIAHLNMDELIPEVADNLRRNKLDPRPGAIDDILHTMACKAAIKINDNNSPAELERLAKDVYENENIRHCPHGRPVMFTISKYELEKQFRRKV